MIPYLALNVVLWLVGFAVIIWKAGWLPAIGLFLVLWANNLQQNAKVFEEKLALKKRLENERLETEAIKADPDRFGDDPHRTKYLG